MRARLLVLLTLFGCDALKLEPNVQPDRVELTPGDTLLVEAETFQVTLTAYGTDNQVIRIPSWLAPIWSSSGGLSVDAGGLVTAIEGGSQHVGVTVGSLTATAIVKVNPIIDLTASAIYINQAIQQLDDPVRLVAGRPGLLRVFLTLDDPYFYTPPDVAVRIGEFSETVRQGVDVFAEQVSESDLRYSYNVHIPGEFIQPDMAVELVYDPEDRVEGLGGRQTFRPEVVQMPVQHQTLVPTISTVHPTPGVYEWINGTDHGFTHTVLPIDSAVIAVHDSVHLDIDLRNQSGWLDWINAIEAIWLLEGRKGYYYGVSELPYRRGIVGLAAISGRVAVGQPTDYTFAHELGHNMSLLHAPCGGAPRSDVNFPNSTGRIGGWGWDVRERKLVEPSASDVMGYCPNPWISSYSFRRAQDYRVWAESRPGLPEPTLMIWGYAREDGIHLQPVFEVSAPPLPTGDTGRYTAEGYGADGGLVFSYRFEPAPLDHLEATAFNIAVPYDPQRDGPLSSITVSGPAVAETLGYGSTPPMAILIDERTGQVRRIDRNWTGDRSRIRAAAAGVRVLASTGLPEVIR